MPKNVQTNLELCLFHMLVSYVQNPSSQVSVISEPRTSRCTSQVQKRQSQRSNCQHLLDHRESKGIPEKHLLLLTNIYTTDYAKAFYVWTTTNWKILTGMEIPDHLTCLLRNLYEVKKQQLEAAMEQLTGSKLGKECIKAVCCHSAYLTYMQSVCVCVCALSVMPDSLQPHRLYPPSSSDDRIFQSRILEWVAISFSRGSSRPRNRTHISCISCNGRKFFTTSASQDTSCEMPGWMNHKLESRLLREISATSDMQMIAF